MTDRHAYLIQAHGNFDQLQLLLDMLDDARNDIFVHIDAKAGAVPPLHCLEASLTLTERIEVNWGGPSQIWSELILLREAVRTPHSYYHLLSGADLPLKTQDYIHDFFAANAGKEFVQITPVRRSTEWRFRYSIWPEKYSNPFFAILNNAFKCLSGAVGRSGNRDVKFSCGPNWFSITDSLARLVVSRSEWIQKVFSHTNNCDEVFLQTVIRENDLEGTVAGTNMRYVEWARSEHHRHPYVFRDGDFELLKGREELFARKFDVRVDSSIVHRIYDMVMKETRECRQ